MKTCTLPLFSVRSFCRMALATFAAVCLTATTAPAAVLTFTPTETRSTVDFTGLADGESISTLGWTLDAASLYTGASARNDTSAPQARVVEVGGTATQQNSNGPAVSAEPIFAAGETVYFQAAMNRTTAVSSGVRIDLRDAGGQQLAGFGIVNSGPNAFSVYANGTWHTSATTATAFNWYELRLVIDLNPTDVTLSVGHLFIRNLTANETEFHLVEDLSNLNMGFTPEMNITSFNYWRFFNGRREAQIGNLTAGVGTLVVPEGGTTAVAALAIICGCLPRVRHWLATR